MTVKKTIPELKAMAAYYGEDLTMKQIIDRELKHTPFLCPKCNGVGTVFEEYDSYPKGLPDSGWIKWESVRQVTCDVCNGEGHTRQEMVAKPVTVTVEYVAK